MNKEDYLSIGEFAAKSDLKRKTLIYYDQIDLFKPDYTNEKGYRFYHYHQLYTINMIKFLREIGLSLDAIKQYMTDKTPDEIMELLSEQKQHIQQKRTHLNRLEQVIDMQLASLRETQQHAIGQVAMIECPAEPVLYAPETYRRPDFRASAAINEMYRYSMSLGYGLPYPMGMIMYANPDASVKDSLMGCDTSFYIRIPSATTIRPEGTYLITYAQGYTQFEEKYAAIREFALRHQLQLSDRIYMDFAHNELVSATFNEFLIKLLVQVQ